MSQSLCFNDFTFSPLTRENQPWFRSSELARALGYKREDQIAKIYRNNSDEFTENMTQLVEILDNADLAFPVKLRIFSLRGCYALAMFARTPVAKAFRRWCLDVIEQYGDRVPVADPTTLTTSTADDRKPLRDLVNVWAKLANVHQSTLWPQVKAHFQLSRIDDLPAAWLPDALSWVQGKIDVLSIPATPSAPALPAAAKSIDEAPINALAEEFRQWHRENRVLLRKMWGRYQAVGLPILMEAMRRIEGGTHRESLPLSVFDKILFEPGHKMIQEVPARNDEELWDNDNPAIYLLNFARAMNAR